MIFGVCFSVRVNTLNVDLVNDRPPTWRVTKGSLSIIVWGSWLQKTNESEACPPCGKIGHNGADCFTLDKNEAGPMGI